MPFDKGLTPALCSRRFSQSARKGYIDYLPSPVGVKFNGERIWSGEYILIDIFDLQRHIFRINFDELCV